VQARSSSGNFVVTFQPQRHQGTKIKGIYLPRKHTDKHGE
jgi:hypothetical protein